MLHLTNGKAIIPKITEAGIGGRIVPWDDVLHEGPVPAGLGVSALGSVRADFLALCGWGSREEIARGIQARDAALERAVATAQEIVLWFEHDLYDQLHLLQILDRLPVDGPPRVTAVTPSTYLGHHPHSDYPHLFEHRRPVSSNERMAARDAWQAFRSPDPRTILAALPRLAELAHLAAAMQRHLQQFPSVRNGLSRTEQQTLEAVAAGIPRLENVFGHAIREREDEAMFMGDAAFLFHISSLFRGARPLLSIDRALTPYSADVTILQTMTLALTLTEDGTRVLGGELDRVEVCGIDRWLGGVHLVAPGPVWRWDGERRHMRFV